MAVQWIRGQQGLVEELTSQRGRLQQRLDRADSANAHMTQVMRAKLEGEIGQLNALIGWLSAEGVQILTEADYDAKLAGLENLRKSPEERVTWPAVR
jgi:hypothetical protein